MDDPIIKRFEALSKAKAPIHETGFDVKLPNDVIFAVGLITLQWAMLYETVLHEIAELRWHPAVPTELRDKKTDYRQESNIAFLRDLGAFAYANAREGAAEYYDRNICHIFSFKADRDKMAHGGFALINKQDSDGIAGVYKGKPFKISNKRIRAVAAGIARCNAFLLADFKNWLNAEAYVEQLRSLHERRAGQDHQGNGRP